MTRTRGIMRSSRRKRLHNEQEVRGWSQQEVADAITRLGAGLH